MTVFYDDQGLPDFWDGEEPEDWWYEPVMVVAADERGVFYYDQLTVEDWFGELLRDPEYLEEEYGMDHFDIIFALQQQGYWDKRDWEIWGQWMKENSP